MASDCMSNVLGHLGDNPNVIGSCNSNDYTCLCASPAFTQWYLSSLCINCNGGDLKDPLSFLTGLCSSFAASISAAYPDSCTPYLGPTVITSSTDSPRTEATPSSSSSPTVTTTSATSSSSSPTTVVLSLTTPSPTSSTESSSRTSTITAIAISPLSIPISSNQITSAVSSSPTFSASSNSTYASASTPTALIPLSESSPDTSTKLSMGAKAGIGASAAVAGIGFLLLAFWALWRRKRSKTSSYRERGLEFPGGTATSTTLTEIYHDDDHHPEFYPGFRADGDEYRGHENGPNYGAVNYVRSPKEKMGLVPSGRIREVNVSMHEEHRTSNFATPVSLHSGTHPHGHDLNEIDTSSSHYSDGDDQENANGLRHSMEGLDSVDNGAVGSPTRESYYTAVGTAMSGLDLGQSELSQEELARLEDEERRIDEAILESERRAQMRSKRGSNG